MRIMKERGAFIERVPIEIVTRSHQGYCGIKSRMKKVFPDSNYTFEDPDSFFNVD